MTASGEVRFVRVSREQRDALVAGDVLGERGQWTPVVRALVAAWDAAVPGVVDSSWAAQVRNLLARVTLNADVDFDQRPYLDAAYEIARAAAGGEAAAGSFTGDRSRCPSCGSPGTRAAHATRGATAGWRYRCGAWWTDHGHWPRNIGGPVVGAEGETATPKQLGRNPQCAYIAELLSRLAGGERPSVSLRAPDERPVDLLAELEASLGIGDQVEREAEEGERDE